MADERILVVEDEEDIAEVLRYNLAREGYLVEVCLTGEAALPAIRRGAPDVVLLDLMLPGVDGLEVFRQLRAERAGRPPPVIMLTAKDTEADIVTGLELGAVDYVTKPFSMRVLIARVRNVLRQATAAPPDEEQPVLCHGLTIDPQRHSVEVEGRSLALTATEFQLLALLLRHPGRVFSRGQIVNHLRGREHAVTDRAVDVHVVALRKKLGDHGRLIETVRGVGYRMRD